eukprot:4495919-Amphidinium_carterae.2
MIWSVALQKFLLRVKVWTTPRQRTTFWAPMCWRMVDRSELAAAQRYATTIHRALPSPSIEIQAT